MAEEGLITIPSAFSVRETIDRLVAFVAAHGLTVFARVDHADGAAKVGLQLRPTELLIFGQARGGTPLMQDRQTSRARTGERGCREGDRCRRHGRRQGRHRVRRLHGSSR